MKLKKREPVSKPKMVVYIILRALVLLVMINEIIDRNWANVFTCVLVLVLFMLPSIFSRRFEIEFPNLLEIIILIFIFAANILGEIERFYIIFPFWDTVLHGINGFICAAVGFAMIDLLNREEKVHLKLSPLFVSLVAFCFSMTVGVLWEFFEFGMDTFFHTDMQKDTWISTIYSVALNPDGLNVAERVDVESVLVNGQPLGSGAQYLDIGLIDTMKDLMINFVGAVVFSVFGWFYIKNRGSGFIANFMPRKKIAPTPLALSDTATPDTATPDTAEEDG